MERLTKITIEFPDGDTETMMVTGVALATVKDLGNGECEGSSCVFGEMSKADLVQLFRNVYERLVPDLTETCLKEYKPKAKCYSVADLSRVLSKLLEDE